MKRAFLFASLPLVAALAVFACSSDDSSSSGGGGPPSTCTDTPIQCVGTCGGPAPSPSCVNGSWTCPPEPAIACFYDAGYDAATGDASTPDAAGPDGASNVDGGQPCGPLSCDPATQYCQAANYPTGDAGTQYSCETIPSCDGATGCACITGGCFCDDEAGAIVVTCDYP